MILIWKTRAKKIVIGIHGLKNKPESELLQKWWKLSIQEGLNEIGYDSDFDFELVYWADLNYAHHLEPAIKDEDDPCYIANPYVPKQNSGSGKPVSRIKQKILDAIESEMDKIILNHEGFSGLEKIADLTIRKIFIDLDTYYHGNCRAFPELNAKQAIQDRLIQVLRKYRHKKILLIAHSMGSIIAYDVLVRNIPKIGISDLFTIGSPLGNSIILKKILHDMGKEIHSKAKIPTPENIENSWLNFSDLNDKMVMNYDLADDLEMNSRKIEPKDIIVKNLYEYNSERNPHKVFGYLRTSEFAGEIRRFLEQ